MLRKVIATSCGILVLTLLTILFLPEGETSAGSSDDYNKYVYSHGFAAYFDDRCAFWDGRGYTTMSGGVLQEDYHVLSVDTGIFGSDNCLYYIDGSENAAIYRSFGDQRKLVRSLPFLSANHAAYAVRMGDGVAAFEVEYALPKGNASAVYVVELENETSPEKLILGGPNHTQTRFSGLELRGNWLFVQAYDERSAKRSLYGYDLNCDELSLLSTEWESNSVIAVRDQTLFWYDPDRGFFSMNLKDHSTKALKEFAFGEYYGFAMCDPDYFYASNCMPAWYDPGFEVGMTRGIYVFDYEGERQGFVPVSDETLCPAYLIADKEYVYFADFAQSMYPRWSLQKDVIGYSGLALAEMK